MKTLLILLTTILLVSCGQPYYKGEPIVKSIESVNTSNRMYGEYKFIVHTDECTFYTNRYYELGETLTSRNTLVYTKDLKDYQLDIVDSICTIYDNNRLVGKCPMKDNMIEQLITIDNQ